MFVCKELAFLFVEILDSLVSWDTIDNRHLLSSGLTMTHFSILPRQNQRPSKHIDTDS